MIDIGTTDFYIGVPSMPRSKFEEYSTHLFDEWEKFIEATLVLPDYRLALEVEEGSVKGAGKIAVALYALYMGIGNYGSFISGLQTISNQVCSVGDFLAERATAPFGSPGVTQKVRKHGDALSRLQRLFVKVQRGELTVEQAMDESQVLLGEEASTSPEFMNGLHESLRQAPRFPQQIELPFETPDHDVTLQGVPKKRSPRPSLPRPSAPPPQQFRVEVWRESKNGKRNVRVIQL